MQVHWLFYTNLPQILQCTLGRRPWLDPLALHFTDDCLPLFQLSVHRWPLGLPSKSFIIMHITDFILNLFPLWIYHLIYHLCLCWCCQLLRQEHWQLKSFHSDYKIIYTYIYVSTQSILCRYTIYTNYLYKILMYFKALLLGAYTCMILMLSWWINSFITVKCPVFQVLHFGMNSNFLKILM